MRREIQVSQCVQESSWNSRAEDVPLEERRIDHQLRKNSQVRVERIVRGQMTSLVLREPETMKCRRGIHSRLKVEFLMAKPQTAIARGEWS
jgi:hypothetical protein